MDKHVFIITDNIVLSSDLSFEYRSESFNEFLTKSHIKNPQIYTDQSIEFDDSYQIHYENIVTQLYFKSELQKAQIIDVGFDHIKLTDFAVDKKQLSVTSVKVVIDNNDLFKTFTRLAPNKMHLANKLMNFLFNRSTVSSGDNELDAHMLASLIIQAEHKISNGPLIILTDLELDQETKNFALLLANHLEINHDIWIFSKKESYLFSANLKEDIFSKAYIKTLRVPVIRNKEVNCVIELKSKITHDVNEVYLPPDQVEVLDVNDETIVKVYDIKRKVLFESSIDGLILINSHDSSFYKKNK